MPQEEILQDLKELTRKAVAHYWLTRTAQRDKQKLKGQADQGLRSAVTGGAQMDGFIQLLTELITRAGIPDHFIFKKNRIELPGFFRPTKEWDLLGCQREDIDRGYRSQITGWPLFWEQLQ